MTSTIPVETIDNLRRTAGIRGPYTVAPVRHGRNNQIVKIHTDTDRYIVKRYFRSQGDTRDRMKSETAFYRFLAQNRLRQVPRLLATDETGHSVLLSTGDGEPVADGQVRDALVGQAIDFLLALNAHRDTAGDLPDASERCSSVAAYCCLVDDRIARLTADVSDNQVSDFLMEDLLPLWQRIRDNAVSAAGDRFEEELVSENCCISPSDFGFHNTLMDSDGTLTFIDFEYAGWDDPARTVCDFFCQVAVPVAPIHRRSMIDRIGMIFPDTDWFDQRIDILMPVSRLKWCCHILNEFLPVGLERRRFAGHTRSATHRPTQFRLAQAKLAELSRSVSPFLAA